MWSYSARLAHPRYLSRLKGKQGRISLTSCPEVITSNHGEQYNIIVIAYNATLAALEVSDLGVRPSAQSSLMKARKRGSLDADFGSVSHQAI